MQRFSDSGTIEQAGISTNHLEKKRACPGQYPGRPHVNFVGQEILAGRSALHRVSALATP
jgi:hypothetical protein